MERTLINHPKLTVREKTGSEGPRHDPYSYRELHVTTPNRSFVVHEGLAVYVKLGGRRKVSARGRDYDNPITWSNKFFVKYTGFTVQQIERISVNAKSRCPMGGYHDTHSERGYPGESFEVCSKCNKVTDSYFCESAVI